MLDLKLGRSPRAYGQTLHWSSLRHMTKTAMQPAPQTHNWLNGMPAAFGMMGNDKLGDCVCAAVYHSRQTWSFNANPPEQTAPPSTVIGLYESACGYNPADPTTDQGCNEQTVLNSWASNGVPLATGGKDKLLMPPVEIDVRNIKDIIDAIFQCGLVFIGFNVPAYIMSGTTIPPVWALDPSGDQTIIGGHAVILCGYNIRNKFFNFVTWGAAAKMKWGFFLEYAEEAYALCDPTWIEKTGKTPLGLTTAQLEALAASL